MFHSYLPSCHNDPNIQFWLETCIDQQVPNCLPLLHPIQEEWSWPFRQFQAQKKVLSLEHILCGYRVRLSRRKTCPSCSKAHARLHELNNPHWEKSGKKRGGAGRKWNFPTWGGKKRPGADSGQIHPPSTSCPTMSGRKNGYKKIKGCRVGGC